MKIETITLLEIRMPLVHFFETSFGRTTERRILLVTVHTDGPEGWGEYHPDALALAAGADLLIHDAFLRPDEVPAQASFGHPAADYAVSLARRASAARVLLAHHKPDRTDDELDALAARFRADPRVAVAAEGQVIDL